MIEGLAGRWQSWRVSPFGFCFQQFLVYITGDLQGFLDCSVLSDQSWQVVTGGEVHPLGQFLDVQLDHEFHSEAIVLGSGSNRAIVEMRRLRAA